MSTCLIGIPARLRSPGALRPVPAVQPIGDDVGIPMVKAPRGAASLRDQPGVDGERRDGIVIADAAFPGRVPVTADGPGRGVPGLVVEIRARER
jgi:hypothetical protein